MVLDPRTPVLVGVGQVTRRLDPDEALADRPEPLALMGRALRAAAEDCQGAAPGGPAPVGRRLLERAGVLAVVRSLSWRVPNPALGVAESLGLDPAELVLTTDGGNSPQALLHALAGRIASGQLDVGLVVGAECVATRTAMRRLPDHPAPAWATQAPDVAPPVAFGVDRAPTTELETTRGMTLPIHVYPLFENALRQDRGWTLEEHRARLGALWSSFSTVAATNPYAWLPEARPPAAIAEPGPDNRMVAFPYTKLLTANLQVDQAAGWILCSVEAARAAGVAEERWVFPLAGAEAHDHWFLSHRADLHSSPAIRLAGRRALELAGVGLDDLAAVDLYSCFPSAVEIAAAELGLATDDPGRPLTVTGGLTFAGGPGNNYVSHSIATMAERLRHQPGSVGLVSGLGWYCTKHALGVFASRPPEHQGRHGFSADDVQDQVDALPQSRVDSTATGAVTVETYTVVFRRQGDPEVGIVACRTADDQRAWGNVTDAGQLAELVAREGCGRTGMLGADGVLDLR